MNQRTKLTLAVSVGTIAIEVALLAALWHVFAEALPLIKTFDQQMIQGVDEQSLLIALGLAWLVVLFMAYHKASDYLRSKMCWALVRHFHGKV
jgi:cbb3-type cytochrome oxidase subunit 3